MGTWTVPAGKLTVRGIETTADGQNAAIKLQNSSSANAWYVRVGGGGTNTPSGGLSIADNTGYHFNMASGGNIGMGIAPSTARLHENGEIKLQGLNLLNLAPVCLAKKQMQARLVITLSGKMH